MVRPKSDIQPRILTAAREVFKSDGVDGASLRDIARRAVTSIGMIYYYYPTKDDLFLAVLEEPYAQLIEELAASLAKDVSVEERLERLFRRVGAMSPVELDTVSLVIREALTSSPRLDRILERFMRGHVPLILSTLADGMKDGTIAAQHNPLVLLGTTLGVGVVPQVMTRLAAARFGGDWAGGSGDLPQKLVQVLLHGLGGPKVQGPRT